MESFSADWLALREPADHSARAHGLTATLAAQVAGRAPVHAIDLAAGTGSNVRYLLPRLPGIVHWTLVDHDAALLAIAAESLALAVRATGATIETLVADLNDVEALPLDEGALVTASALLDLVSDKWIARLAHRVRHTGARVLFALNYDGRLECDPPDSWDARIRDLVNHHQRTDKGFGPALGPDAMNATIRAFGGRAVEVAPSDWELDASHAELQRQLVDGWAEAARATAPDEAGAVDAWRARRIGAIAAGTSRIRVGHVDIAG